MDGLPAAAASAAEGPRRILLQTNNLSTVSRAELLTLGVGCLQKAELLHFVLSDSFFSSRRGHTRYIHTYMIPSQLFSHSLRFWPIYSFCLLFFAGHILPQTPLSLQRVTTGAVGSADRSEGTAL